jgi:hypothetical protein
MFAHILVALDGSGAAEQVLPYVEALGERFGASMTLLRATTPPGTVLAETAGAGPLPEPELPPPPADAPPTWPDIYFFEGTFALNQEDLGCTFSATPYSAGIIDIDVDQTLGVASGTLHGSGAGTRNLACEGQTGTMHWSATYDARFSGPYDALGGAVSMTGELAGTTTINWSGCTSDGTTPMDCPAAGMLDYVHPIALEGTIDPPAAGSLTEGDIADAAPPRRGRGTWTVQQDLLATEGAWAVGTPQP